MRGKERMCFEYEYAYLLPRAPLGTENYAALFAVRK